MSEASFQTTYDEVPYPAGTYPQSHPRRLATMATVFGLDAPPIHQARILELGSADGANLVPMATQLPEATFVGVERSSRQIEQGQQLIQELGLTNVTLQPTDILEITAELGEFDYIIAHGVYSWVPQQVREKILEICKQNLSPQGVAYISYNTFPGWRMRGMLRDMMLYHIRQFPDAQTKVQQARALITFLAEAVPTENNPYGLWLTRELEDMARWQDNYFYHDSLEEVNEPVYFHEFMSRAGQQGLQFLGETEFSTMVASNFGSKVNETLSRIGKNIVAMEQYMDFVRNRMFRQTLLCHSGQKLRRNLTPEILDAFCVGSNLRPVTDDPDIVSRASLDFTGAGDTKVASAQPVVKAAMLYLSQKHPRVVPFGELLDAALGLLQAKGVPVPEAEVVNSQRLLLGDALLKCFSGNLIELVRDPYDYTLEVKTCPRTPLLIRKQAEKAALVTNLRHESVKLDGFAQTIIPQLDGEHDRDALLNHLIAKADAGTLVLRENDEPLVDREKIREVLSQRLTVALDGCARAALLLE